MYTLAKKDYYEILGVNKSATQDEIKSAYRKLAKQFHPDVYKGDRKVAEEKFKEISEAYEVLADQEKRKRYDRGGMEYAEETFGPQGFDWSQFTRKQDVEDIFGNSSIFDFLRQSGFSSDDSDIFGARNSRDLFGKYGEEGRKGRDLVVDVDISLEEAVNGGEKLIRVPIGRKCQFCSGTGLRTGKPEKCPTCKGARQVRMVQQRGNMKVVRQTNCPQCGGSGYSIGTICSPCEGAGYIQKPTKLSIKIKPGVDTGYRIRIPRGGENVKGYEPGDLYVSLRVKPHPIFERKGDDLYMNKTIPLSNAILGGTIDVKTIDGSTASVTIPPGTQPHTLLRLKGRGIPRINDYGRGDMYIRIEVHIPTNLTNKQKNILKEALGNI